MKNFIQDGNVLTVTAPAGGVTSGDAVAITSLFGVAAFTAIAGAAVEVAVMGVFELPKVVTDVVAVGDTLYWDSGQGLLTTDAGTSRQPKGRLRHPGRRQRRCAGKDQAGAWRRLRVPDPPLLLPARGPPEQTKVPSI